MWRSTASFRNDVIHTKLSVKILTIHIDCFRRDHNSNALCPQYLQYPLHYQWFCAHGRKHSLEYTSNWQCQPCWYARKAEEKVKPRAMKYPVTRYHIFVWYHLYLYIYNIFIICNLITHVSNKWKIVISNKYRKRFLYEMFLSAAMSEWLPVAPFTNMV